MGSTFFRWLAADGSSMIIKISRATPSHRRLWLASTQSLGLRNATSRDVPRHGAEVLLYVGKTRLGYGGGDAFLGLHWGSEAQFRHFSRRCCGTSRFGGDFGALPFVEGAGVISAFAHFAFAFTSSGHLGKRTVRGGRDDGEANKPIPHQSLYTLLSHPVSGVSKT